MRDDSKGGDLLSSGSYTMISLQVRVVLYLGFEQGGEQEVLGNPATCARKFASVTGIKPETLFPSASFQGKSCGGLLLYALQALRRLYRVC